MNETPEDAHGSDEPKRSVTTIYSRYRAYLLRIWQETPQMPWRASLQCTVTGQRRGFRDLESLFAFLEAQAEQRPQATNSEAHDSQEG